MQVAEEQGYARNDYPPYNYGAEAYNCSIFQSYDVSHSEYGSAGVYLEHKFGLVGNGCAQFSNAARELFVPQAERRYEEVVQPAYCTGFEQQFYAFAARLPRHEHLRRCRGFGERIFAVHVFDEILAERYQEQYSQHTSKQGGQEHFYKVYRNVGIFGLQYVQGRKCEYGSGNHTARAGAYALYYHVFAHGIPALGCAGYTYGYYCYWYGSFEHLAHLEAEVCRRG